MACGVLLWLLVSQPKCRNPHPIRRTWLVASPASRRNCFRFLRLFCFSHLSRSSPLTSGMTKYGQMLKTHIYCKQCMWMCSLGMKVNTQISSPIEPHWIIPCSHPRLSRPCFDEAGVILCRGPWQLKSFCIIQSSTTYQYWKIYSTWMVCYSKMAVQFD